MLNLIIAPMNDLDIHRTAAELTAAAHDAEDKRGENALNKAIYHYAHGVRPELTTGGYLIASATAANVVYRVSDTAGCNCEAAQKGRICWHQALIEIIEAAQARAIPPYAPVTQRPSYEDAMRELSECFS